MKRIITIAICLFAFKPLIAGNIGILIKNPTSFQVSDSVLSINVSIQSTYSVDSAIAYVNGRQVLLTYSNQFPYYYQGTLSLAGFNQDTLTLHVLVKNVQNNRDSASVPFIYDKLPVLAIIEPLNYSVARPLLPLKVRCVNKDSCIINARGIVGNSDTVYAGSFVDSINTTIDLSRGEGSMVVMSFSVTDKRGQTSNMYGGEVFVESSPYLTKVYEGRGLIIDYNYGKVLVSGNGSVGNQPPVRATSIVDIHTKDSVVIPNDALLQPLQAYLTPAGAIFLSPIPGRFPVVDSVIDWTGSLNFFGYTFGTRSLSAKGNYAIWTGSLITGGAEQKGLAYRNYAANTNTLISNSQGIDDSGGNDISADGTAAYSGPLSFFVGNLNVFAYKNGNTIPITNNSTDYNISNFKISTDGKNFLYDQYSNLDFSHNLHLFDGQKDTLLALLDNTVTFFNVHKIYQANNNFLVFPKKDQSGLAQLWLKDSLGNYAKITSFSSNNGYNPQVQLDLLNEKGDLLFYGNNWQGSYNTKLRRYFESKGQIQEICSGFPNNGSPELCRTYYRDSSWYIAVGRALFRINPNIAPNTVTNANIHVKKDSVYGFSSAEFAENFKGPGQLIYSMVTSLPANGTLQLNGAPVAVNAVIVRADLDRLAYVPNAGFTGVDSFAWNGSNGINYTASPGLVRIEVTSLTPPERPILAGIGSSYCSNQGVQKVKIKNLPDTSNGTHVLVKLDSTVLAIAGDASFSFNVDSLNTSIIHVVSVTFSNLSGTAGTIDSFRVIGAVTPRVSLSVGNASNGIISSNNLPITLIAKAVSGGGASPEYSFASDRTFHSILQPGSHDNTVTIQPSSLHTGSNCFYVQMKTSDSCYTVQVSIDSIQILRNPAASLVDPDYPNQPIGIYPNPFDHQLTISGLQASKRYGISMTGAGGTQVFLQSVTNSQQWQSAYLNVGRGIYALRLYDETKNRVIGVIKIVAK